MFALISPRLWIAIGIVVFLAFTHGMAYRKGSANVQAKWDAATAKQVIALAEATAAARNKEQALQRTKDEAINAAAKKTQLAQASAAASRRTADSLRDELASTRAELSSAPIAAVRQRADSLSVFLGQCANELTEMARRADRIAIERDALIQAWPR